MALSQAALGKLARDLKDLQANAIDGVKVGGSQPTHKRGDGPTCSELPACQPVAAAEMFGIRPSAATAAAAQVVLNDDNLTDIQAEYEGPGAAAWCRLAMRCVMAAHSRRQAGAQLWGVAVAEWLLAVGLFRSFRGLFRCFRTRNLPAHPVMLQLARRLKAVCSACGWPLAPSSPTRPQRATS